MMPLIEITEEEISIDQLMRRARRPEAGAIVSFTGTVRDDGIEQMVVEAFPEAAKAEMQAIVDEATGRFSLLSAGVVHRTGSLAVGESIVAIVCSAAHRQEAFDGCRYIIEELKSRVPIWKKEIGKDGGRWVEGMR
ncbi:MAG TPA: molybdenum cofactor biosynthesis protein MoaE [Methanothrix sp.]|jgi:molybdopterin synthase catalytic subunit|nr:molybdenum cofactor biosynthesis protein MoaE [Methanothrix sp.]HPC88997.1 molybdenum cofactor biosynthesis protein MoaE [Methanothrix sp.]HQE86762.1 molybdenum cofactor biosynthesis protein MoaE [Methanothrix sp.]HQI67391.1 molybdenum cofactor biosynthesis protein MoaE [Methanothrix sp.]HRS84627.1 molybdenum cofactor biosynthesis protein MoaE [Methanothrix sp.]